MSSQALLVVLMAGAQLASGSLLTPELVRRDDCVPCPSSLPVCPVCPNGETCSSTVQTCQACPVTTCIKLPAGSPGSSNGGSGNASGGGGGGGTSIGAIVGGLLGALVVIGILGFFTFRHYKKRRQQIDADRPEHEIEKENNNLGHLRDARASTHTVGSIASTVLTRASNVIQIAYIPGVTNRSNPNSPGYSIPPVPPIPGGATLYHNPNSDQLHFSAEDILRQSAWSTNSADARSSVATTIYRKHAVVSPVVATGIRAKAAVVDVKSSPHPNSGTSTPGSATPPVPPIDYARIPSTVTQLERSDEEGLRNSVMEGDDNDIDGGPLSPAFSVGSTFLKKSSNQKKRKEGAALNLDSMPALRLSAFPARAHDNGSLYASDILVPPRRPSDTGAPSPSSAGRSSPATFREGDIRMSFRPMSDYNPPDTPRSARGKSPFSDEHRLQE